MDREPDFRLEVSQHHIGRGVPNSSTHCPIALALCETGRLHAWVSSCEVRICASGDYTTYHHNGGGFIDAFDFGEPVGPSTISFWEPKTWLF